MQTPLQKKKSKYTNNILPVVSILNIYSFCISKEILKTLQFVSKDWYEAGNHHTIWRNVVIKTLHNRNFQYFLKTHGKHFRTLQLKSFRLSRNATYQIKFNCRNLKQLCVNNTYSNSMIDNKFCFLISRIKTLVKLVLPTETTITTDGFKNLCELYNLETLVLKKNNRIQQYNSIEKLKALKVLNLSNNFHVDNNICKILGTKQMKHINLSYCYKINRNGILSLLDTKQEHLENLTMNGQFIDSTCIEKIASQAPKLKVLSLNCLSIDSEVYKLLYLLKNIEDLSIIGCSRIKHFCVFNMKSLSHLCICRTSFDIFGKHGLVEFATAHPNITFHLYDTYRIRHNEHKAIYLLKNVILKYS